MIIVNSNIQFGFMTFIVGLQADVIANNRKILEDIQYRTRRLDYDEASRENSGKKHDGTIIINK